MAEKKQLNEEQLNKVAGGTYVPEEGYVFYTMEEVKKLEHGAMVSAFKICDDDYIFYLGTAQFRGFNDSGFAKFHCAINFTVGDNEIYYVGPLNQYEC